MLNAVTYSNEKKSELLGVEMQTLQRFGAVSAEVAGEMAVGIKRVSGCEIGLSITGIAGPDGGSAEKPVGLVFVGVCGIDNEVETHRVQVNSAYSRADIKWWFSQYALNFLRKYLEGLRLRAQASSASAGAK